MSFGNPQVLNASGSMMQSTPVAQTPPVAQLKNRTPPGGVPLGAAAVALLAAQAPNDGQQHPVTVHFSAVVTAAATNGGMTLNWTCDGVATHSTLLAGNQAAAAYGPASPTTVMCDPGTVVSINQTALTGGAIQMFAEIDIT